MINSPVRLDLYDNTPYSPGRNRLWQVAWLFFGLPLFRCSWIPSSSFRAAVLRSFGARVGKGVVIRSSVAVKYPWHLTIGDHCWIGERCWIDNLTTVRMAAHVCVSQGVYFCPGSHDWTDRNFGIMYAPIFMDEASWAGAHAILLAGTHLQEGAIVTAGSVASGTIPAWEIHSGHPARFVRRRELSKVPRHDREAVAV